MAAAGYDENVIITGENYGENNEDTITTNKICEPVDECPICLDDFEECKLDIVTCGCGYMSCRKCTQSYLLHTTKDPHCMHCKRGWDRGFQYDTLTPAFVNNKYKKHRKKLLLEREKSRLPEAQPFVETYKNKDFYANQLNEIDAELTQLRLLLYQKQRDREDIWIKHQTIKNGGFVIDKKDTEKRAFIKKCPGEGCRGFLSTSYKCDLCKVFVCSHCLEIKGLSKDTEHTCDPSNVESAKAIKKETRPCPKCAVPIFKISGCDQMWCTQCQVAFSWKTGRIDQGRVHNPHFYQYMQNNDIQIRAPGEEVCGGLPGYYYITQLWRRSSLHITCNDIYNKFMYIYRGLVHIQRVIIDPIRERLNRNENNMDLRVKYLANEVDEAYVAKYAMQRDNIRQKNTAMLQVFELYNVVMTEQFNNTFNNDSITNSPNMADLLRDQLSKLFDVSEKTRMYCNSELEKISKNYNMKVYIIDDDGDVATKMKHFK